MPEGWLNSLLGDPARLRHYVLQHVVRGSYSVEQLLRMKSLVTLDGGKLIARNSGGHGTIGGAGFSIANIHASNGMLHGIDSGVFPKRD